MAVESVTTPGYTSSNFSHNSALWRSFTRNMGSTATDIQGEQISTAADIQGEQIAQLQTYEGNRQHRYRDIQGEKIAQLQIHTRGTDSTDTETYKGNR
jgi:hypothetical protein